MTKTNHIILVPDKSTMVKVARGVWIVEADPSSQEKVRITYVGGR